jgi:hypothetical protein
MGMFYVQEQGVGSQYQGNDCIEGGGAGGVIPPDLMH